jgi:hypothetical protein
MGHQSAVFVIFSGLNVRWRPGPALWIIWCGACTIELEIKIRKTTPTSETHVYLEVCSMGLSQESLWTKIRLAQERKRKYKEHRPVRKFNREWQAKRPWLKFDDIKNSMPCAVCIEHYGTDANVSQNLENQNKFITGCTNFRISAVTDHETCKSHATAVNITVNSKIEDLIMIWWREKF